MILLMQVLCLEKQVLYAFIGIFGQLIIRENDRDQKSRDIKLSENQKREVIKKDFEE